MRRIAVATVLVLVAAALAGVGRPEGARAVEAPVPDSVTVIGSGSATYVPDQSSLTLSVDSRGPSAAAALDANAKEMRAVIDAVRAACGVALSTQQFSLSETYVSGVRAGFSANNSVEARVAIPRAGAVIDAAVAAGANRISGSAFSTADRAALYRRALKDAVANAREKAQLLATAGGRALGKVKSIAEQQSSSGSSMVVSDSTPPIVMAEQELRATVTVTFALS